MPLAPLSSPHQRRDRFRAVIRSAPALAGLWTSLLAVNGLQMASLAIRPVSHSAFRRINRWVADTWWGWTVAVSRQVHGVEVVITGGDLPVGENAVVVANHQQMPDITLLMHLAAQKERLGDMKWILKRSLKYVPGAGWGLAFLDAVFVERDWMKDRETVDRAFAHLREDRVPLWLMLFVEGTRLRPENLEKTREFAQQQGWEVPRHVLLPRTKGFVAALEGLRGHVEAVYDVTIGYEEGVPSLGQYALGYTRRAHLHVRRYPVADLPTEADALGGWLRERWQEKDALLADYYANGHFG